MLLVDSSVHTTLLVARMLGSVLSQLEKVQYSLIVILDKQPLFNTWRKR
jgi:hypothetical protein